MTDGRPERPTYTTGQYIGAADLNAETGRVSTSPVQAAAREVGFMC